MSVVGDSPYRATRSLEGEVVVASGSSRGIGRQIAVRAGADGALDLRSTQILPPKNFGRLLAINVGHTVGKYAESLLTLGWASEFAAIPIAVNSVWPATTVASTGMMVAMGEDAVRAQARSTQIMADAVHAVVTRRAADCTGHFYTDEDVLREEGVTSFDAYRLAVHEDDLTPSFYLSGAAPPKVPVHR